MDFSEPPGALTPEQRLQGVAAILALGLSRARIAELANQSAGGEQGSDEAAARPLDPVAKTRLSVDTVYGAERSQMKRADGVLSAPRRLSPQHPSSKRARHG
jgi:hypothetical protein